MSKRRRANVRTISNEARRLPWVVSATRGSGQAANDSPCREFLYFPMTRNGIHHAGDDVSIPVVVAAMPDKYRAFLGDALDEVAIFQAYSISAVASRLALRR